MLHTARNTCCWASFQKGLVWCFPKNLSRSNVKCLKALREVFTSLASARRNWRAHVKSFQVILIQQQTGCFFFFFHTRAHKLWKKKRNALISRILDFWKMYGNRVTNSSGAVFYGGHTSDRYFMWWLFFHHLSEIKWIFHLSEIIVRYRKDFSQNKRGQSEHRITGEVKPTVFLFFFPAPDLYIQMIHSLIFSFQSSCFLPFTSHFADVLLWWSFYSTKNMPSTHADSGLSGWKKTRKTFNSFPLEIEVGAAWSRLSWWFHTNVLARCSFFQQHIAVLFLLLHLWSE